MSWLITLLVFSLGMKAQQYDLIICRVKINSTYSDPHHFSSGFSYVLVNGIITLENNQHNGNKAGKAIYNQSHTGKIP